MDITPKTILEVNEDNILIQLEGLEHLLYEEDEGVLSFEINQQFIDEVAENVQKQLQNHNLVIETFWGTWADVLYSAVSDTLKKGV
jgi:hypothetical protein